MESWTYNGVKTFGEKNWLVGKFEDREVGGCIILGCSKAVWGDYEQARKFFKEGKHYDIIAINDIGIQFKAEHIDHIVSLHHQMPGPIRDLRMVRIQNHPYTHSIRAHEGVDFDWGKIASDGGTSAIFAAKIAIAMGYKKIIACGCGLDKTGHYYDPDFPEDNENGWFDRACQIPWEDMHKANKEAKRRIRFMSGHLTKIYGKPDYNWIYGGN